MTIDRSRDRHVSGIKLERRGKKKTYHASFWHKGKHDRKSLKTSNFKAAQQQLRKLIAELEQGDYDMAVPRLSLEECVKQFINYLETDGRRSKTKTKYSGVLKDLLQFTNERRIAKLASFHPTHFDAYRAERKEKWAPYTLYNYSIIIKQFFGWAHRRNLLKQNPLQNYRIKKQQRPKHASPVQDDVKQILKLVPQHYRLLILVLACSGMRSGELCRLRVEDVDLQGNWFHIISRPEEETKSGRSRKVPIHYSLRPMLEKHRSTSEWVFTRPPSRKYPQGGRQMHPKRLNEMFTRRVRRAGFNAGRKKLGFVVHSLRGFFKSIAINSGVPQPVVDIWLDHSLGGMNAFYYQLSDEDSQRFMKKIEFDLGC